jgi:hypothetical protein
MEVYGQLHAPAALPPKPIAYEAMWAPEPVWTLLRREKSLASERSRTPTVQPLARRFTDYIRLSYPALVANVQKHISILENELVRKQLPQWYRVTEELYPVRYNAM